MEKEKRSSVDVKYGISEKYIALLQGFTCKAKIEHKNIRFIQLCPHSDPLGLNEISA